MWHPTAALRAALGSGDRHTGHRFDVLDEDGTIVDTLTPSETDGVTACQVTCDAGPIRWTGSMTVVGEALIPRRVGDLLHPLSYTRVRPWVRHRDPSGTWHEVPLAPMYVDGLPELADTGLNAALTATVTLSDAVALIKRAGWRGPLRLGGKTAHEAIRLIVANRAPWLTTIVTTPTTTTTLPSEYDVGEPGGDPWTDVEALCEAGGMIAYVDRDGALRIEERPTNAGTAWEFAEGPDCLMVDLSTAVDLDRVENVVAVQSDSEDVDPPVVGWWQDNDPTSPLYAGNGHELFNGIRLNPGVTTVAQAERVAAQIGAEMRAAAQVIAMETIPVTILDPWDAVTVTRARIGAAGAATVQSWTLDLDPTGLMALTVTGRVEL